MTRAQLRRKTIKAELAAIKAQLTEKGYRDYLEATKNHSTEYFQAGGRGVNINTFEHR